MTEQASSPSRERLRLERRPDAIREMFAGVARRYDLLNRLLSLRRDVGWRRSLVGVLNAAPPGPVLDLATGTGDVALAVCGRRAWGADFCIDMLAVAAAKSGRRTSPPGWVGADALALPFRDRSFAAVTVAFGVRNFVDLDTGLAEIRRVLSSGGLVAVLEFHRPSGALTRTLVKLWNRSVVTPVGRLISDDGGAYAYLPASVDSFSGRWELAERLRRAGFGATASHELSGGIAVLTVAHRTEDE